jgi:glycerate 2-kinase
LVLDCEEWNGGIVDGLSLRQYNSAGIDVAFSLSCFDSLAVLVKMGDAIFTGHTGINVNDLKIALID